MSLPICQHYINFVVSGKLYQKPIPEDETQLPSPEDLKGYIIVKVRQPLGEISTSSVHTIMIGRGVIN